MSTTSIATVITDAGFSLLRAAPGHKLIYTRAVCGSGHVEKTQLTTLTEVTDYVMDLSIVEFGPTESAATLRLQLDNSKAPQEFQLYQIGIYAKLLDGEQELIGETLIQIMQYEEPDIVRAVPHVSEFVVNVLLGQAETVEGIIDMAAYVSIRQFSSRTVNGKPLSADVILTSEDIKVSDSDPTTVNTALSNKAEKYTKIRTPPQTWEDVWALEPGVYTWVQYAPITAWQPEDTPTGELRVELTIHSSGSYGSYSMVLAYIDGQTNLKRYVGEHGFFGDRLALIATATISQEFDLPLASGMSIQGTLSAKYSKDQFGGVVVRGCLIGEKSNGDVIATLPVGFRPAFEFEVPATFGYIAGRVQVNTQGTIRVITDKLSVESVQFFAAFVASE